jgi:hypothetical protein
MSTPQIAPGQILKARAIGDSECIFTCEVIRRNPKTVKVLINGKDKVCKVHTDANGEEYIYALGTYSMAPIFRPSKA